MARRAFGIARVERLPGNVGYLDIKVRLRTRRPRAGLFLQLTQRQ